MRLEDLRPPTYTDVHLGFFGAVHATSKSAVRVHSFHIDRDTNLMSRIVGEVLDKEGHQTGSLSRQVRVRSGMCLRV